MATEGVSTKASTWSTPVTPTSPRLFACVRFPNWPIARRRRRRPAAPRRDDNALPPPHVAHPFRGGGANRTLPQAQFAPPPVNGWATTPGALVLIQTTADRQIVVAACDLARAAGVRPGMSLAQARALCP